MKIAVCVKWVPVVARMKFDPETKRVIREGVPNELNAYDVLSVQRAVELKQSHGAEVVVFTMGPPNARDGLVRSLAMGADRAYHIIDPALAGSDTLATAQALALALCKEQFDLFLFGNSSVDAETGQVGPEVAELMGIPQITSVEHLEVLDHGEIRCERALDDGTETVETSMPALVAVTEGIAPETFPDRDAIKNAENANIGTISAADLTEDLTLLGSNGSPTWVSEIRIIESQREQRLFEDAPLGELAEEVAKYLRAGLEKSKDSRVSVPRAADHVRPPSGSDTWIVAETSGPEARPVSFELITAAQAIASENDGRVVAFTMVKERSEALIAELGAAGADAVITASGLALDPYDTDAATDVLSEAIRRFNPYAVLLPSTANGRDLAGRTAARLRLGLTGDAVGFEVDPDGTLAMLKPAFGGNVVAPIYSKTLPNMATVRPGLFDRLESNAQRIPEQIEIVAPAIQRRVKSISRSDAAGADAADLDGAEAVICVGMGVGSAEAIAELDELRDLLGAQYICTRDVVEAGWMPKQLQVGLTGRSIAPSIYLAVGVRGDFNHTVGIQRAGCVVAINNNRRASFFRQADIGILADWREFIPELVRALKQ